MHNIETAVKQGMERVVAPDTLISEDKADELATAVAEVVTSRVYDLGSIRIDDVVLILAEEVRYYERAVDSTNVIIEDTVMCLVNEERRRLAKTRLKSSRKIYEEIENPESRVYRMTAHDAAKRLASAAEFYGRCMELVNQACFMDREATAENIMRNRAWRKAMGSAD